MDCKWLLLVPFFRDAYIGAIACTAAENMDLKVENYSLWLACADIAVATGTWAFAMFKLPYIELVLACIILIYLLLTVIVRYYMLKLHTRHALWKSILSLIPLVMFYMSFKLNSYAEEAWEESR